MGSGPTEDENRITTTSAGVHFAAQARTAELRQRERAQVDAAVASELDLVLRGLPHSESVLRYAAGELASLRDVLVAAEPGAPRQLAALRWLDDAGDELNARWAAYELVMASRDPHREANAAAVFAYSTVVCCGIAAHAITLPAGGFGLI